MYVLSFFVCPMYVLVAISSKSSSPFCKMKGAVALSPEKNNRVARKGCPVAAFIV